MIFRKAKNIKSGDFVVIEGMTMGLKIGSTEYVKDSNEVRIFPLSERTPRPCLVLAPDDYIEIRNISFKYFDK